MRRLSPVKQKNPLQCWTARFPAPPLAHDTFRPLNSIAAVGDRLCALAPPPILSPVRLTSIRTHALLGAVPVGVRRSGAAIFEAGLNPWIGRAIHGPDRRRNAVARTRRLGLEYSGSVPARAIPSCHFRRFHHSQHSTCSNRLRFRSTAAACCLAVGPAACLPAN
jgi:hypothetical protein